MGEVEEDEVTQDGAEPEASGAAIDTKVRVSSDGSLLPVRAEVLALAMADGFGRLEAWKITGAGASSYRTRIETHPVFKERVKALTEEKTKLETEGASGEVLWVVKQNWRLARASGDVAQIHRATTLLVQTHKDVGLIGSAGAGEGGGSADGSKAEGPGPGRPAHQPRATRPDVASMKRTLMERGQPVPGPALAPEPAAP